MEQLKYLHIYFFTQPFGKKWKAEIIAHAAGRVPFLEVFSLFLDDKTVYCETWKRFVFFYGKLYPGKKLHLKLFRFVEITKILKLN